MTETHVSQQDRQIPLSSQTMATVSFSVQDIVELPRTDSQPDPAPNFPSAGFRQTRLSSCQNLPPRFNLGSTTASLLSSQPSTVNNNWAPASGSFSDLDSDNNSLTIPATPNTIGFSDICFWLGTRLVFATGSFIDHIHTYILWLYPIPNLAARFISALFGLLPRTKQTWLQTKWLEWFLPPNVIRKWKETTPTGPAVVEFIRRTYRQDWPGHPQKRSLRLLVRFPGAMWHVTVTFPDAPKAPETTPPSQQRRDLEGLCRCIDFDRIPLLRDTVTELVLSTKGNVALPVKAEPNADSLYSSIIGRLRFCVREDPLRARFPPLNASGKTSTRDASEITKERELAAGVHVVRLHGDEREYVYKEVDRPQYLPEDTEILQRELRNLEQLPGSEEVVRLVATISSTNPYRTAEVDAGNTCSFLRGFLLEYHPNGTLQDALQSPEPEADQPWRRWALQIARGLNHLHCHGITHLDLKPSNIVISANNKTVLVDIGGGGYTYEWLAPDMRDVSNPAQEPFEARAHNDVWAFGMMLSQMADASRNDAERKLLRDVASLASQRIPINRAISLLQS